MMKLTVLNLYLLNEVEEYLNKRKPFALLKGQASIFYVDELEGHFRNGYNFTD